jgi:hypothetical protein
MSYVIEVKFSRLESDTGEKSYKVTWREGQTGENPHLAILYDGPFAEDAMKAAQKYCKGATEKA